YMPELVVVATKNTTPGGGRYTAVLGPQGRIVIPVEIRKQLGLEPSVVLNIWEEDGEIHLSTQAAARAAARKMFRDARGLLGKSLADELVAERHAEAARDLADEA
ncbi:MAG: hypothetical protein ABI400_06780, partial [Lacisediminihabitans sp.]